VPHDAALIATVAAGIGAAFLFGLGAVRLGLPPLVGYLVAGIVVGPFTPGFVADSGLSSQLAELGVILLMFGVGLHFSLRDLAAVRHVVLPGAVAQATITAIVGTVIGRLLGLDVGAAVVLGLSVSVASTVVLLKALERRDRLDSPEGRLAVGWLVVEDVLMVFVLVLLPALAPAFRGGASTSVAAILAPAAVAIAKVAVFVLLMYFVGRRFVPWLLEHVARLGSRELFTLSVIAIALGVGTIAAELFGVSFALGAFFAGAVISESELSQRAAADALPMQDAFAVLFFVSVGMLFDPRVIVEQPVALLTLVALVVVWKSALAFGTLRLLGQPPRAALLLGTSLGQIGEFSFIVAALGLSLGLVTRALQTLVVAAAIVAITLNGPMLAAATRLLQRRADLASRRDAAEAAAAEMERQPPRAVAAATELHDPHDSSDAVGHVVLVGYGRVGHTVAEALTRARARFVVVEEQERIVGGLRARGDAAILGDATRSDVLTRAGIAGAALLVVTAPEPFRARRIVEVARAMNPRATIAVRTHSAEEQAYYEQAFGGASHGRAVYAEREAALSLAHYALTVLGRDDDEADVVVEAMRGQPTKPTEVFSALATQEYQSLLRGGPS
jgi:monovalent cation:H+ antiporter-2, CPA2 family